jgi:PAS domain S-box-containing protein
METNEMKSAFGDGTPSARPPQLIPHPTPEYAAAMLGALPVAVYATDAVGKITYYNEAAVELWGVRPELGTSEFCGSWKLYWPDGTPLPHHECPMAIALREKRANQGFEAIAERPDGTRVPFAPYPVPLFDGSGNLIGAVNTLVNLSDRQQFEQSTHRLKALVESSEDAIVAKDLNGNITNWNPGAERLFGHTAEEVIGKPITIIIPPDRLQEEPGILARIRNGERVEHFETIRQRKDGTLVDISLTVSPIRDHRGRIIGASKIARDITERKRAQERQGLLLREMSHRVKNLFALSSAIITLSTRQANTPQELAEAVRSRLGALARAHDLTMADLQEELASTPTTLEAVVQTVLAPYVPPSGGGLLVSGPAVAVQGNAVTSLALLLHEAATNAAKYGALARSGGQIAIAWSIKDDDLELTWTERGGPRVEGVPTQAGFGTFLTDSTVSGHLNGVVERKWPHEGLILRISAPLRRLSV